MTTSSSPRTSSPLNPTRTAANSSPQSSPSTLPVAQSGRARSQQRSTSASRSPLRSSAPGTNPASPPSELSQLASEPSASHTRSLSGSPSDRIIASSILENTSTLPPDTPPSTWWGRQIQCERPWHDPTSSPSSAHPSPPGSPRSSPKPVALQLQDASKAGQRKINAKAQEHSETSLQEEARITLFAAPLRRRPIVPKEQTEGWEHTRERVAEALSHILPPAILITHNLLQISTEVLKFAPIPGLDVAASLLLSIWDNVQGVDMNRLACLRLAERCANLFLSIVKEVHEEGDKVEKELTAPLQKLAETFTQVRDTLIKQARRPFLMRYLKREEILGSIAGCNTSLTDALSMFSLSVQMRILRQAKETEDRREAENRVLLEALVRAQQQGKAGNALGITVDQGQLTPRLALPTLPGEEDHTEVLPTLRDILTAQNTLDFAHDAADLRALLRNALAQSSDVEMLRVLQVGRDEMPEALKTLQRTLERVGDSTIPAPTSLNVGLLPPVPPGSAPRGRAPQRSATLESSESGGAGLSMPADTLDREFIEGGIDALQRMSRGGEILPSWTITRYEVERDVKIGMGFFSDVYRGTWRGRTVAIKCLAKSTPRDVFVREINIWKELRHPNVLQLYGASAATGDGPWFFVCPYERFGNLNGFLRRVAQEGEAATNGREGDLLQFMHEIAKGMEYLHDKGVLHGDLKAANILVDDRIHCLVSDFGQSEMKSEVYRISGAAPPHGTLRWQAPELMLGSSDLTPEMDVYSYAICCFEILSMGRMPWPLMSDEAVRDFVLKDNTRPKIPSTRFNTPALQELLRICWHKDPAIRPPFSKIVKATKQMRKAAELPFDGFEDLTSPPVSPYRPDWPELDASRPSPDMHPVPLPNTPPLRSRTVSPAGGASHLEDTWEMPETVVHPPSSRASSILTPSTKSSSVDNLADSLLADSGGYESPMPVDEHNAEIRNERRYRLLLMHDYHPSLTLPLWNPVAIALGAVGFLDKSSGKFVTLFNCFHPEVGGMPSVYGYGRVTTGSQRQDKRTVAQRGLDAIPGLLTSSQSVSRRYTYPLRIGHKAAYLCTETTMYRYVENLDASKKWFKANVDAIMRQYGPQHELQKEDLYLVIGTLDTPEYSLFVSHNHPDGRVHFNVFSAPKTGQPWGTFTTDTEPEQGGPSYDEPMNGSTDCASKVSRAGGTWDTVIAARLRFRPDVLEPTSL
ncbi:hypothetical protein B0H19DRAFT_1058099 [Mycena capillaripes]|nr:hypothetical protein B0H19DRAFT_1058099 [Mycena capillaripes]